jgi:hypothetical protein
MSTGKNPHWREKLHGRFREVGVLTMRFALSYEGPLPSSGNDDAKWPRPAKLQAVWAVRDYIKPQLDLRFKTHSALQGRSAESRVLRHALIPPVVVDGHQFFPLAKSSFKVKCGLEITMLVNHDVASVLTQAGDLDNRLKTLFDGLRCPIGQQEMRGFKDAGREDDDYMCLLEDDALITSLKIETLRNLLAPSAAGADHVKASIMVTIDPAENIHVNRAFRDD